MIKTIIKFFPDYKKFLVPLLTLELMRGFLIISAAMLMMQLVEVVLSGDDVTIYLLLILFIALILRILIENFQAKKFSKLSLAVQEAVRHKLHSAFFIDSSKTIKSGELLTLIFDTVESFDDLFRRVLPNVLTTIILVPMILIVSVIIDPLTALIFLLTLPIAPFLLYLIGRAVSERNQRAWSALSKLNSNFKELLSAITTLKIFRQVKMAISQLKLTSEKSAQATLDVLKLAFVSSFALELITTLAIALIAVTIGLRLVADKLKFDVAFFLLLLAPEFYAPIRQIGIVFHSAIKAKESAEKLQSFLDVKDFKSKSTTVKTQMPPSIKLVNVSFTYSNKKSPTFQNVNMTFEAGTITAILGESGSGKSTLLKLITGLNFPTEGEIFLNDLPMSDMDRDSLFQKIAYVPQQPHLFSILFKDNITMFNNIDDIKVKNILCAIDLNFNLNDNINSLSRGQLQRLGLARALLKDTHILILDEPTAGLDIVTEKNILRLLDEYCRQKTVIIATHRPKVIEFASQIIFMDDIK